jgi:hypothetical protein
MLPKKYTGYSYLLDNQNRIRWRGCGMAQQEEVDAMLRCASELLNMTNNPGNSGGGGTFTNSRFR